MDSTFGEVAGGRSMKCTLLPLLESEKQTLTGLSQAQVAQVMTERGYPMSQVRVGVIERRALKKLQIVIEQQYPWMKEEIWRSL